jgi:hypothetical protein
MTSHPNHHQAALQNEHDERLAGHEAAATKAHEDAVRALAKEKEAELLEARKAHEAELSAKVSGRGVCCYDFRTGL